VFKKSIHISVRDPCELKAGKWRKRFYLFVNIFYSFFFISLQMSKSQLEV